MTKISQNYILKKVCTERTFFDIPTAESLVYEHKEITRITSVKIVWLLLLRRLKLVDPTCLCSEKNRTQ